MSSRDSRLGGLPAICQNGELGSQIRRPNAETRKKTEIRNSNNRSFRWQVRRLAPEFGFRSVLGVRVFYGSAMCRVYSGERALSGLGLPRAL